MARIDVLSWKSWSTFVTSRESRYVLVVTLTLPKYKPSEKTVRKDEVGEKMSVASTCKAIPDLKPLKLINDSLCHLTDRISVPEV